MDFCSHPENFVLFVLKAPGLNFKTEYNVLHISSSSLNIEEVVA